MTNWKVKYQEAQAGEDCLYAEGVERTIELPFLGTAEKNGAAFGEWYKKTYGETIYEKYDPAFYSAAEWYQSRIVNGTSAHRETFYNAANKAYEQTAYDPFGGY